VVAADAVGRKRRARDMREEKLEDAQARTGVGGSGGRGEGGREGQAHAFATLWGELNPTELRSLI
jgi:hypothetical protein